MPVMPFLSRRRSALDVLTANLRDDADNDAPGKRPATAVSLAASNQAKPTRTARPVSVYGTTFASSRLSHEVRREDIPDSPSHASEKRRSKRFSMLKMRNFSETQLSFRAQVDAGDDVPPMPALPASQQMPAIIRTAPTTDMGKASLDESRTFRSSFIRPASRRKEIETVEPPRKSMDTTRPKKTSLRWRKRQGKSTGLEDLLALSAREKQAQTLPALEADTQELALPIARFSESSRSDGSHASSSDLRPGTTQTTSTQTNFFRLPRRNKHRNSLFPLPVKIPPPEEPLALDGPATPHASSNTSGNDEIDPRSPPLTALHRTSTSGSPSKRNTIISQNGQTQSPLALALQAGQSLARRASQRSRNSSTSSPLQPPMRLGLRDRASTTSSLGRGSMDTPPLINGSTRNSTSTTGRSSLAGFLNLSRFRQDSDVNSPGTRSKSNSFALSREALVIPEREEGDTPGKYLERLEATVSRSVIATILSKSSDPFAQAVLRSYTRRFPFFGEPIDMSLRKFLLEAELPKETQQVDRVIQAFADRYHECNPGVFISPDQAYIIAFSLMMLHTDAFNKNNKRKMQKQDYVKNTSGQRVSNEVLGCFYDNICYTPFVHYDEEVDINGERVLPFKPKKIKMKAPAPDANKKPSGPVDPYNLLIEQKLDALRPSIKDSIMVDDPYSYMGAAGDLNMKALQRAFTHTGVLQIISARSRPTAYESHFNKEGAALGETEAGVISIKITKVGILWRKAPKKKKTRSPWQEWGAILTGSQLYLFKNAHWTKGLLHQFTSLQKPGSPRVPVTFKPPLSEFKPDALIKTDDAVALVDATYTRHKHAFTFVRHGGQEEVFLADNDAERSDWLALINYATAFRAAGVRIRGMLGVSYDDARTSRRPSATSTTSADKQPVNSEAARTRQQSTQLSQQVMLARKQVMIQRIADADSEMARMNKQLDDLLRDARHLLVLAPIAAKTREDVIFAAARADANIKWIRRDIWRVKAHRDIIALDVQEDGISAAELQSTVDEMLAEKSDEPQRELARLNSTRSGRRTSAEAFTALTRSTSVREAVDEFVDDVFRSPLETVKAAQSADGWRLPPLQLDVTDADKQRHGSISSAMLSVPIAQSERRYSTSQASMDPRPEHLALAVANTPEQSTLDTDNETTTPSLASEAVSLPPPPALDGAKDKSPESSSKRGVRRSLQKSLREAQQRNSIHRHRRGKDSESTVRSGGGEVNEEELEGTPGLERAKGRFILHGKQASVIEFGEDWPNERMKMRRDQWRNTPRTPKSAEKARRATIEDGRHSPVVQLLNNEGTDEETDEGSSAAQSFMESAELADQYAGGTSKADSDSDDERQYYDLSSWDPDAGRRGSVIGPNISQDLRESDESVAGAEADEHEEREQLGAIDEQSNDGYDTPADEALHKKEGQRTVIRPSTSSKKMPEGNDDWLAKSFEQHSTKRAAVASSAVRPRLGLDYYTRRRHRALGSLCRGDSSSRSVRGLLPGATLVAAGEGSLRREKDTEMVPLAGSRRGSHEDDYDALSEAGSAQAGVKRLEAISSTWSKWDLYIAYFGLSLVAFAMSLEAQTTTNLTVYATSAYKAHSLVSTVLVVQGVVLSVVKPPMSKIADVFGRFEAFTLSVVIYTIGYVQQAASSNVETYAAAQIFYSAGQTGLQILIQIFIADTSDLVNRAICATIPYTPYLINVWVGAPIADTILHQFGWRWGYGIWAVVLPVAYIPLALALAVNQRRAAKKNLLPPSPFEGKTWFETITILYYELDFVGLTLLCTAFSFILIPLSLAATAGWNNPSIITLLVLGGVCLIIFPFWERSKKFAPRAFFPGHLFRQRTVLAGLGISFFYFMAYYLSVYPYFQSYLLVVQGKSVTTAGHIVQTWTFAATVTSICVSFIIKRVKRYRVFVTLGAGIYLVGLVVMLLFRREGASMFSLVGTQILVGMGGGMLNIPAQTGVQASASHGEVAAATAIFLTFLEIGGACGSAISGAIWTANVPRKLRQYLPEEARDQASAIYGNISLASTGWEMGTPTRQAINRAYQETMTYILMVAVCAAVPVILLSLVMQDYKLDEIEQHVKGVVIGGEVATQSEDDERQPFISSSSITEHLSDEEQPILKGKGKQASPRQGEPRKGS